MISYSQQYSDYAANIELAEAVMPATFFVHQLTEELRLVDTPNAKTIKLN